MEGEAEIGVATAKGKLSPTGALYLSRLAIDSDWCSQQKEAAVVGSVGGETKLAWEDLGTGCRFLRGHVGPTFLLQNFQF